MRLGSGHQALKKPTPPYLGPNEAGKYYELETSFYTHTWKPIYGI